MSDKVFLPFSIALRPVADVSCIMNKELRETLTLRSLILLCEACCIRPTALMLAFALQNSIPGLVGLPMDNANPEFYLGIARRYFDPTELTGDERKQYELRVHNYHGYGCFFPPSYTDLDRMLQVGRYEFSMFDYFISSQMDSLRDCLHTKKRRTFVRDLLMRWRAFYAERGGGLQLVFVDHVVRILEYNVGLDMLKSK
jgi:hypothetical protein